MNDDDYSQMMIERMQMFEEAIQRAETGVATEDDWNMIRWECGVPRRPTVTLENIRSES